MLKTALLAAAAAMALAMPAAAAAAQIYSTSYDTPNGDGVASGGGWNYWDGSYSGSGSTNVDGAALTGGSGDLTDGYAETASYLGLENAAGSGPYVGWLYGVTTNPLVTFHFAGSPTITDISIQLENTSTGGVYAPDQILIDGINTSFVSPGGVGAVNFTGLNLSGASHTIQFNQRPGSWTFVSEVSFYNNDTGSAAPEPSTWAMLIAGFGMAGATLRRRRAAFA